MLLNLIKFHTNYNIYVQTLVMQEFQSEILIIVTQLVRRNVNFCKSLMQDESDNDH